MILVDTSIWIDHLRRGDPALIELLNNNRVCLHPFVLGELACGNLNNREEVLSLLRGLPQLATATDDEVLYFIDEHDLMGHGIGYVDAHLLAAAKLTSPAQLWTRDRCLQQMARDLGIGHAGQQ